MTALHHAGPQRGFTLAELIMVVVILSVVLAMTLPRMAGLLTPDPFKDTGDLLIRSLAKAREKAMLRQERWGVLLDLDARSVRLQSLDSPDAAEPDGATPLPGGVFVKAITLAGETLTSGLAVIRILPTGLAEPCRISLGDGDARSSQYALVAGSPRLVAIDGQAGSGDNLATGPDPAWEKLP